MNPISSNSSNLNEIIEYDDSINLSRVWWLQCYVDEQAHLNKIVPFFQLLQQNSRTNELSLINDDDGGMEYRIKARKKEMDKDFPLRIQENQETNRLSQRDFQENQPQVPDPDQWNSNYLESSIIPSLFVLYNNAHSTVFNK